MSDELKSIQNYIHTIERKLATGDATEHTHRSSLEALVQSWASGITATNEPKHIESGTPDFILRKGSVTVRNAHLRGFELLHALYFTLMVLCQQGRKPTKRHRIAQTARLCSEPIAVMQVVAELLGRDLAVGYRPVR